MVRHRARSRRSGADSHVAARAHAINRRGAGLLTVAALSIFPTISCAGGPKAHPPAQHARLAPTTVAETYKLAERSLREGGVYHATITGSNEPGAPVQSYTRELWVDVASGTAREEVDVTKALPGNTFGKQTRLIFNGESWFDGKKVTSVGCVGVSQFAQLVLGCYVPHGDTTVVLEQGTYDGHAVLVLVARGTIEGGDSAGPFTGRIYLDRSNGLPLATTTENRAYGTAPTLQKQAWQHQFIRRDSLPKGFFDPMSLGWHA